MPIDPKDQSWLKEWALKIGGSAYLLFVFAFMTGHPVPGSVASLTHALGMAIIPALIATFAALGVMLYLRKR
jgi:hypothetical protein